MSTHKETNQISKAVTVKAHGAKQTFSEIAVFSDPAVFANRNGRIISSRKNIVRDWRLYLQCCY